MRLIDTMVLVGALNPKDSLHQEAFGHLDTVKRDLETFLPLTSAVEFDLVIKGRGFTAKEREDALNWLAYTIPSDKVVCNSLASLKEAAVLQERGMGYFDSMIAALALESDAVVVTKDREISGVAKTTW